MRAVLLCTIASEMCTRPLETRILKSNALTVENLELSKDLSFTSEVGQNTALYLSPNDRNSFCQPQDTALSSKFI